MPMSLEAEIGRKRWTSFRHSVSFKTSGIYVGAVVLDRDEQARAIVKVLGAKDDLRGTELMLSREQVVMLRAMLDEALESWPA